MGIRVKVWDPKGQMVYDRHDQRCVTSVVSGIEDPLREPTFEEMRENFRGAVLRWSAAGFPVVSESEYRLRTQACEGCEFWDGKARFGLGKCKAPGCGCTKLKRFLATEKCPLGKWPLPEPENTR